MGKCYQPSKPPWPGDTGEMDTELDSVDWIDAGCDVYLLNIIDILVLLIAWSCKRIYLFSGLFARSKPTG